MKKYLWVTDLHLEFVKTMVLIDFIAEIESFKPEGIIITGDIAHGRNLDMYLKNLDSIGIPVYFVLGNHDFYGSCIAESRAIAGRSWNNLYYLSDSSIPVRLSESVALIGIDGWADGTGGVGRITPIRINDFGMIDDYWMAHPNGYSCKKPDPVCFDLMSELAIKEGEKLRVKLHSALTIFDSVIVAMHVPPFEEASMHEGNPGEPGCLPFFSSPTIGKVLKEVGNEFPERRITVLAGHTHSEGYYETGNITVQVAGAEYEKPRIAKILEIEGELISFAEFVLNPSN